VNQHISVITRSQERLEDITYKVNEAVKQNDAEEGICFLFLPHTTAGLMVSRSQDPNLVRDILDQLRKLVPADAGFRNDGGNSEAHIKASLLGQSIVIPIEDGQLALGRGQSVFLAEFDGPRERSIMMNIIPTVRIPLQEQLSEGFRGSRF